MFNKKGCVFNCMKKRRTKLEKLLKERNITAYELSDRLGYRNHYTVYKWIYGKGEPKAAMMLKLMVLLEVSAEEILHLFAE